MNDFVALDLSSAGMRVQRQRMRVVSENLANQHTTGPDGPYQRKEIMFSSEPVAFERELRGALEAHSPAARDQLHSVVVSDVRHDNSEPVRIFDPNHPQADAEGYVAYPNISIMREMADMIEASRSYEANLAAAKATRKMLEASLDLARR